MNGAVVLLLIALLTVLAIVLLDLRVVEPRSEVFGLASPASQEDVLIEDPTLTVESWGFTDWHGLLSVKLRRGSGDLAGLSSDVIFLLPAHAEIEVGDPYNIGEILRKEPAGLPPPDLFHPALDLVEVRVRTQFSEQGTAEAQVRWRLPREGARQALGTWGFSIALLSGDSWLTPATGASEPPALVAFAPTPTSVAAVRLAVGSQEELESIPFPTGVGEYFTGRQYHWASAYPDLYVQGVTRERRYHLVRQVLYGGLSALLGWLLGLLYFRWPPRAAAPGTAQPAVSPYAATDLQQRGAAATRNSDRSGLVKLALAMVIMWQATRKGDRR